MIKLHKINVWDEYTKNENSHITTSIYVEFCGYLNELCETYSLYGLHEGFTLQVNVPIQVGLLEKVKEKCREEISRYEQKVVRYVDSAVVRNADDIYFGGFEEMDTQLLDIQLLVYAINEGKLTREQLRGLMSKLISDTESAIDEQKHKYDTSIEDMIAMFSNEIAEMENRLERYRASASKKLNMTEEQFRDCAQLIRVKRL